MNENVERARGLLSQLNVDFDEVWGALGVSDPEAVVLLAGSITDGFANASSDVDLVVILPSDRYVHGWTETRDGTRVDVFPTLNGSAFPQRNGLALTSRLNDGRSMQVLVTKVDMVEGLQNQVNTRMENIRGRLAGRSATGQRRGFLLRLDEQQLLHRVHTGLVLEGEAGARSLRSRLGLADFASYNAIVRNTDLRGAAEDLRGLAASQGAAHAATLQFLIESLLVSLAGAILGGIGEPHPKDKFLFRLLRRHEARIGKGTVDAILERYASAPTWASSDPLDVLRFIDRTLEAVPGLCPIFLSDATAWRREYERDAGAPAQSSTPAQS